jgi:hypothetical protein
MIHGPYNVKSYVYIATCEFSAVATKKEANKK